MKRKKIRKRKLRDQNLETLRKLRSNKVQSKKRYKRKAKASQPVVRRSVSESIEADTWIW